MQDLYLIAVIILVAIFSCTLFMTLFYSISKLQESLVPIKEMFGRIYRIETLLVSESMGSGYGSIPPSVGATRQLGPGDSPVMFQTKDGKYVSSSPEELLEMIRGDSSYSITPEEEEQMLESMRRFQENFMRQLEEDDDEEDDDDSRPIEW